MTANGINHILLPRHPLSETDSTCKYKHTSLNLQRKKKELRGPGLFCCDIWLRADRFGWALEKRKLARPYSCPWVTGSTLLSSQASPPVTALGRNWARYFCYISLYLHVIWNCSCLRSFISLFNTYHFILNKNILLFNFFLICGLLLIIRFSNTTAQFQVQEWYQKPPVIKIKTWKT